MIATKILRYLRYFDWIGFSLILIIACIGLIFVFSATYTETKPFSIFFKKQAFGVITGIVLYVLFSLIDYRTLCQWGYFAYIGVITLLIFTLIKGNIGMGAQRWINIVAFKFQPSEIAKLFFPAFITYHLLATNDAPTYIFKDYGIALGVLGISTLLVIKQPDLGTGLLILFSGLIVLWLAGLHKKYFMWGLLLCVLSAPLAWKMLKPYQQKRIAVFLGMSTSQSERYQLEQSKIAIGSGGFKGKGLLQGTQNRLMFLPEGRTDFIFAIIGEEWGFLGSFLIIILYTLLFIRILSIIYTLTNFFAQLLAFGLMIHIALATYINIAMVIGFLPVVGIPLPLLSYGISNLWITFASLGWINGVSIRRYYVGQ
jgi:rod shape determining protein RodA